MRVSIVIPALNEERNIGWVLDALPAIADEVILVDGDSTDRTVAVSRAHRPDIRVIGQAVPGKGAALRAGFAAARGDFIVMLDADRSMDPAEIPAFVAELERGADVVKGSRFLAGGGTADISLLRRCGNGVLREAVNALYGAPFSDLCYGFFGLRRSVLKTLDLRADGFEIETEIVVRALRCGMRITEVPSFEAPRAYGESNLRTWRDGTRVLGTLVHRRFAPSDRYDDADMAPLELAAPAGRS